MDFSDFLDTLADEEICGENVSRVNLSHLWEAEAFDVKGAASVYGILFTIGVPLNIYILAVIIFKKLYSQPTYILLLNLTVSDLLMCFFPLFFKIITNARKEGSFGNTDFVRCNICKVGAAFITFNTSIYFTMMLLSVERLIIFKTPLQYDEIVTTKRIAIALVVEWTVSIAIGVPTLADYGSFLYSLVCGYVFLTPYHIQRGIVFALVIGIIFAFAATVLIVCNIWIVYLVLKIYNSKRRKIGVSTSFGVTESPNQASSRQRIISTLKNTQRLYWSVEAAKRQCAFIRTLGIIILINGASLIPSFLVATLTFFSVEIPIKAVFFVETCLLSQTITHPMVQALFAPELQKLLFRCTGLKNSKFGQCVRSNCDNCCTSEFMLTELASQLGKMHIIFSSSRGTSSGARTSSHHDTGVS